MKLIVIFCSFFLLTAGVINIGSNYFTLMKSYTNPQTQTAPEDYFFVYATGDELSHYYLWEGIGDSIANAKNADVIIVGNSRAQLGLLSATIQPLADTVGLKFFWLSTGYGEKVVFFDKILKRHNFSNKIVIVPYESLLSCYESEPARNVQRNNYWDNIKTIGEKTAGWMFVRNLHSIIPKIKLSTTPWGKHALYRSPETGAWFCTATHEARFPIRSKPTFSKRKVPRCAEDFLQQLKANTMIPIITDIPTSTQNYYKEAKKYAQERLIPFIGPQLPNLYSHDKSHLAPESAKRFSVAFWEEFKTLDAVKTYASNKKAQVKTL